MFGKWAGYAGFLDILHGLGQRLKILGTSNPFECVQMAHHYFDSNEAIGALRKCGEEVSSRKVFLARIPRQIQIPMKKSIYTAKLMILEEF